MLGTSPDISKSEKRKLATLPEFTADLEYIKNFPVNFEAFFKDHFGLRNQIIELHHYIKFFYLDVSPVSTVVIGKDGWLFLNDSKTIDDHRGLARLTPLQLEAIMVDLEDKRKQFEKNGITYLRVIAPNKHSIYPEYLPDRLNQTGNPSRLDQLQAYLKKNAEPQILDLREPLMSAKQEYLLYQPTDNHWNSRGALVAYRSIIKKINQMFPQDIDRHNMSIIPDDAYESQGEQYILLGIKSPHPETRRPFMVKSPCAKRKNKIDFPLPIKEKELPPFSTECENASLKVLVFRDSFFTALIPFFSEHFREVIYSWDPFYQDEIEAIVTKIQPDIVVEQSVERFAYKNYLPEVCHNILGNHSLKNGNYAKAASHFREALKIVPDLPDSINNLGYAMLHAGRIDDAIIQFKKALKIQPGHQKALRNLKSALANPKRIDKTIAQLQKRIRMNPEDHWSHYNLGRLLRKKGAGLKARSHFEKALSIKPDYTPALESLASLYAEQGNLEMAISYSLKMLRRVPEDANTYYNIACLYARQNKKQDAVSWLEKAIEKGYDNRALIQHDKDLENIRSTSFYKSLEF